MDRNDITKGLDMVGQHISKRDYSGAKKTLAVLTEMLANSDELPKDRVGITLAGNYFESLDKQELKTVANWYEFIEHIQSEERTVLDEEDRFLYVKIKKLL